MSKGKASSLLFGAAAGIAIGAALIGLLLVGVAVGISFKTDSAAVLTQHPLFVSGSDLVRSSVIAGLPLFVIWYFWRKQ